MDFVQYRTGKDDEGRRLDKVLRILFPDTPLSAFYSALRKGLIRVNNKKVKQDHHIVSGDVIYTASVLDFVPQKAVPEVQRKTTGRFSDNERGLPSFSDICILKNDDILILNKPYDIPVHETGSYKGMTLNQLVIQHFDGGSGSLSFRPGPLHRLDRKTTGLLAFSQSIHGARLFTDMLKAHKIKKTYLSVVDGHLDTMLTFTDYLTKDECHDSAAFHTVRIADDSDSSPDYSKVKKAVTTIKPAAYGKLSGKDITLAEICIETGRTHQIRSQCSAHGFPLAGDSAYDGSRYECIFLHAWKMEFEYPNALGLPQTLTAPVPERFQFFIEKYLPSAKISLYNTEQLV